MSGIFNCQNFYKINQLDKISYVLKTKSIIKILVNHSKVIRNHIRELKFLIALLIFIANFQKVN